MQLFLYIHIDMYYYCFIRILVFGILILYIGRTSVEQLDFSTSPGF